MRDILVRPESTGTHNTSVPHCTSLLCSALLPACGMPIVQPISVYNGTGVVPYGSSIHVQPSFRLFLGSCAALRCAWGYERTSRDTDPMLDLSVPLEGAHRGVSRGEDCRDARWRWNCARGAETGIINHSGYRAVLVCVRLGLAGDQFELGGCAGLRSAALGCSALGSPVLRIHLVLTAYH